MDLLLKIVLNVLKTSRQFIKKFKFLLFIFLQIILLVMIYVFYDDTDFSKALTFFIILNFIFSFLSFTLQIIEKIDSKIENRSKVRIFVVKQLDVFRNTSISFDLFILFTAVQIFKYGNLYAQEQATIIENIKKSNEELKITYKELEDSLAITNLKLERQKNINLRLEESISPRTLNKLNITTLKKFSGLNYSFKNSGFDEVRRLKAQIDTVLKYCGWLKKGDLTILDATKIREGITIHINKKFKDQKVIRNAAKEIQTMFSLNKIDSKILISEIESNSSIEVEIGMKSWKPILEIGDGH